MNSNRLKSTPKDVFLHLFNIVTFYLSVIGFITLFIQYINALFPDELNYYFAGIASGVRWSTSVLFIAIIAYVVSAWMLEKDLAKTQEKRNLKLRKWLIYFTLFISAVTVIVDLMIFVFNFLEGELDTRFFLKVLVVLVVAVAVFGYYMWDLRRTNGKTNLPKILAIVVLTVSFGSIVAGFFIIGTPTEQRDRRFDTQRTQDLEQIQNIVSDYWMEHDVIPEDLTVLEKETVGFSVPTDPITHEAYEYNVTEELSFELCAVFAQSSDDKLHRNMREEYYAPVVYKDFYNENWNHDAGRMCFSRTIDPELYKDMKGELLESPVVPMR